MGKKSEKEKTTASNWKDYILLEDFLHRAHTFCLFSTLCMTDNINILSKTLLCSSLSLMLPLMLFLFFLRAVTEVVFVSASPHNSKVLIED